MRTGGTVAFVTSISPRGRKKTCLLSLIRLYCRCQHDVSDLVHWGRSGDKREVVKVRVGLSEEKKEKKRVTPKPWKRLVALGNHAGLLQPCLNIESPSAQGW